MSDEAYQYKDKLGANEAVTVKKKASQ